MLGVVWVLLGWETALGAGGVVGSRGRTGEQKERCRGRFGR